MTIPAMNKAVNPDYRDLAPDDREKARDARDKRILAEKRAEERDTQLTHRIILTFHETRFACISAPVALGCLAFGLLGLYVAIKEGSASGLGISFALIATGLCCGACTGYVCRDMRNNWCPNFCRKERDGERRRLTDPSGRVDRL